MPDRGSRAKALALVFALLALAPCAARAQAGAGRGVTVPDGYGLDLGAGSAAMRYASDLYFAEGRINARGGVAPLAGQAAEIPRITELVELPLTAGTWYAVNDRQGQTHLLRVVSVAASGVTVTVAPAAGTMLLEAHEGRAEGRAVPAAASGDATPRAAPEPPRPQGPAGDRPPLPPLEGNRIDLSVYHMAGGELTKYYLRPDGTFLRQYVGAAALGAVRRSERGDYAIQGNQLVLRIWRTATAATGGLPQERYLAGSEEVAVETERHRFRLVGAGGAEIDGTRFQAITGGW